MIEVIDTGKGIDSENLKHIWDKYYKVDKQYRRVTHGTGLGLSIVKNILELHQFKYGVESKKNKGTKFFSTLTKSNIFAKITSIERAFLWLNLII